MDSLLALAHPDVVEWAEFIVDENIAPSEVMHMADLAEFIGLEHDAAAMRAALVLIIAVATA